MSELREAIEEYIALRKSLGAGLKKIEPSLRNFVTFAESKGFSYVTVDVALRWAKEAAGKESATSATRLQIVRGFTRWRQATDPRTEIPPKDLIPYRYCRKPSYIYSDEEIEKLLRAAHKLPGLKGPTYSTLFGLLSVTGMRLSEALALDRDDVDLDEAVLTIRLTKFRKSRLVPIHESTRDALANYAEKRDRILARPSTAAFFVSHKGIRVTNWAARYNFA